MNETTRHLTEICGSEPLGEKWLIAPSRRVGYQWLDAVTRARQPVVNVRVKTVRSMALELAGPELLRKKLSLVPQSVALFLLERAWREDRPDSQYLGTLHTSVSLIKALHRAVNDIRLAGLARIDMPSDRFEAPVKAEEILFVLREYLTHLRQAGFVDYAEVMRVAVARVRDEPRCLVRVKSILIPESIDVSAAEDVLLKAIPKSKRTSLHVDHPGKGRAGAEVSLTDSRFLRWIQDPPSAPNPARDGSATIYAAVGEVNEVREIFRRCLEKGRPLDQVEILHTNRDTYVPLIYDIASRYDSEPSSFGSGIKVTFAEGVSAQFSRPGRALVAWLSWIKEGFPQSTLMRMIQEGLLKLPSEEDGERLGFSRLAMILRISAIGLGRERYPATLGAMVRALEKRLESYPEDDSSDSPEKSVIQNRLEAVRRLYVMVKGLLEVSPDPLPQGKKLLQLARRFLEENARAVSEPDTYARKALLEEIERIEPWVSDELGSFLDCAEWLAALPSEVRILGSGPKPGHIHVSHYLSGGHTGRPHTYILGLDEGRFPGAGIQDPILLDSERSRLSTKLQTSSQRLQKNVEEFARLVSRLRGTITMSFSSRNIKDDREVSPSSVLVNAYRVLSGDREGDQSALLRWLPPAASFGPDRSDRALDDSEWWLWRLSTPGVAHPVRAVAQHFPHLGRGILTAERRISLEYNEFDGRIVAGPKVDPTSDQGPVLSASSLELLGRCPLAYFFKYVLGVSPPEELTVDPDRWLDPLATGSLLHEVFREFLSVSVRREMLPEYERDQKRLFNILERWMTEYRGLYPPPSESVYRREKSELQRAARIFLLEEEVFCRSSSPAFLETSIGMRSTGGGTKLDTVEPIQVTLPNGRRIRVRGRIDRIDQLPEFTEPTFSIWDYKTGSPYQYRHGDPFRQGRLVQHTLYLALAEERLKAIVSPEAKTRRFGYFFPGLRGRGDRVSWDRSELSRGGEIVQRLCTIPTHGAFLPTQDSDDCRFCDYRKVCGDLDRVTQSSARKLQNQHNVVLTPLRELRGIQADTGYRR